MKSCVWFTCLTLLFIGMLVIPVLGAEETDDEKLNLIHVSGTGTVKVVPDRCEITFSVNTKNPDVRSAQKENSRKMEVVMAAMKDSSKGNLNASEISTSAYTINEVYSPDDALKAKFGENVTIYEVSNTITIETSQISRVGDLIDLAVSSGANGVSSLKFTVSKEKNNEMRTEALKIAVQKAQKDADTVLSALGKTLGAVHTVSVEDNSYPPYTVNQDYRSELSYAAGKSAPIEPGMVEVTASVSVAYLIS